MAQLASTTSIRGSDYFLEVYLDPFNKRIRVDDYRGNINKILRKAEEIALIQKAEKLILKVRSEDYLSVLEKGCQPEAYIDRYFLGSDAYIFSKFYCNERRTSDHWLAEDTMIQTIFQLEFSAINAKPPKEYKLIKVDKKDAEELSFLYKKVFPVYPTPLHDPDYVTKTMKEGTIYFAFHYNGKLVSAASAEVNRLYKNAELTDCATLKEHRKYGLMKLLLQELEGELKTMGIYCVYSIARATSFGMNAVLFQLGYRYRGRLMNNVLIYDKIENMNMWVKDLATADF